MVKKRTNAVETGKTDQSTVEGMISIPSISVALNWRVLIHFGDSTGVSLEVALVLWIERLFPSK